MSTKSIAKEFVPLPKVSARAAQRRAANKAQTSIAQRVRFSQRAPTLGHAACKAIF
jgi:hypothetical protein